MVQNELNINEIVIKKLRAEREDLNDGKHEAEIKRLAGIETANKRRNKYKEQQLADNKKAEEDRNDQKKQWKN